MGICTVHISAGIAQRNAADRSLISSHRNRPSSEVIPLGRAAPCSMTNLKEDHRNFSGAAKFGLRPGHALLSPGRAAARLRNAAGPSRRANASWQAAIAIRTASACSAPCAPSPERHVAHTWPRSSLGTRYQCLRHMRRDRSIRSPQPATGHRPAGCNAAIGWPPGPRPRPAVNPAAVVSRMVSWVVMTLPRSPLRRPLRYAAILTITCKLQGRGSAIARRRAQRPPGRRRHENRPARRRPYVRKAVPRRRHQQFLRFLRQVAAAPEPALPVLRDNDGTPQAPRGPGMAPAVGIPVPGPAACPPDAAARPEPARSPPCSNATGHRNAGTRAAPRRRQSVPQFRPPASPN